MYISLNAQVHSIVRYTRMYNICAMTREQFAHPRVSRFARQHNADRIKKDPAVAKL